MWKKKKTATRKTKASNKSKVVKLGSKTIKIKHPWSFGSYCRSHWYKSGCDPRCISSAIKSWNKTLQARWRLAKALCKMSKKKR